MKIKGDFVTNSSTSCYIVYVPEGFKATIPHLQSLYKDSSYYIELYDSEGNELTDDQLTDEMWQQYCDNVNKILDEIRTGDGFDLEELSYDYDSGSASLFNAVLNPFIIRSVDVNGGGGTIIVPITRNIINEINEIDNQYANKE